MEREIPSTPVLCILQQYWYTDAIYTWMCKINRIVISADIYWEILKFCGNLPQFTSTIGDPSHQLALLMTMTSHDKLQQRIEGRRRSKLHIQNTSNIIEKVGKPKDKYNVASRLLMHLIPVLLYLPSTSRRWGI